MTKRQIHDNLVALIESGGWAALVGELEDELRELTREWLGCEAEARREQIRARIGAINWVLGLPRERIRIYGADLEAGAMADQLGQMPGRPYSPVPPWEDSDE